MKNIKLEKHYIFHGYSIYQPDELLIIFSYTPNPIEQGASFGFMWQAEVDGVVHEGKHRSFSENPFITDKEKEEMFEIVEESAIRTLDGLLADKHKDL